MSDLRVLTDAELDIVGGGAIAPIYRPAPSQGCCSPCCGPSGEKLVKVLVADILRLLDPCCGSSRPVAKAD